MQRLLAPLLAGVAALTFGGLLAFADQTHFDEPGDPRRPMVAQQSPEPYVSPPVVPSVQHERLDVLAPPRPMDLQGSVPEDQPPIVVPEGGPEQEPGPNPQPRPDPVRQAGHPEPGKPLSPLAVDPGALGPAGAIAGEATRGPTCPGPVLQGQVCEEPAQVTIDVRDQAGQVVAHFQTDTTGRFLVPLPPGTYTLEATRPPSARPAGRFEIPHVWPQQVTITSGVVEQVSISIDTGIR